MRLSLKIGLFAAGVAVLLGMSSLSTLAAQHVPRPPELAQGAKPLDAVALLTIPAPDVAKAQLEDITREANGRPQRFALPHAVQLTPATSGTWERLDGDRLLWRLRIAAPGARNLNLGFTRYRMPEGGKLWLYTPNFATLRGPFTAADNEDHGQLWTPILSGDELVIEVELPAAQQQALDLTLSSVNYGYRDFSSLDKSGSCNVDVVCPEGAPYSPQIRSVAVYSLGGGTFCTGALINNTAQDGRPFFLTADHCEVNAPDAPSLVTYWNYQNSTCRVPGSPESGQPGDGQLNQFMTGGIFRAEYEPTDMTLLELDDPMNPAFNAHWAGWDRSGANATRAIAVHHPSTDEKRISFENDPTTVTSYGGTDVPGDGTHVRVIDWDLGTTEPGSSGSPLFDQNGRIIGQLHGGGAACGNDQSDYYGRFSVSWDGGGTNATRLSNWLDPLGTGALTLNGRDQQADAPPVFTNIPPTSGAVGVPLTYTFTTSGSPPPTFSVTSGTLPPGLTLNPTTGVLSGVPTTTGTFGPITITATNGIDPAGTQTFTMVIGDPIGTYLPLVVVSN